MAIVHQKNTDAESMKSGEMRWQEWVLHSSLFSTLHPIVVASRPGSGQYYHSSHPNLSGCEIELVALYEVSGQVSS